MQVENMKTISVSMDASNIILINGRYGQYKKIIMGQHDGSINMIANGERIAKPCDINELILEISLFTKINMKTI